jgi:hypothetical protein
MKAMIGVASHEFSMVKCHAVSTSSLADGEEVDVEDEDEEFAVEVGVLKLEATDTPRPCAQQDVSSKQQKEPLVHSVTSADVSVMSV